MIRRLTMLVLSVVVVLSLGLAAGAQEFWNYNVFPYQYERFRYEVVNYRTEWDWELEEDVVVENKQYQFLELRRVDDQTMEVTQGSTQLMPMEGLSDNLTFLGGLMGLSALMSGGDWFGELWLLGMWAADLELEVGNNMQMFDGSRVRVVEETSVAGVRGYLLRKFVRETDESGNRVDITKSEWVVAPDVGWPLALTMFSEEGDVVYRMTLVEYERK
jgi:hypothetical protein